MTRPVSERTDRPDRGDPTYESVTEAFLSIETDLDPFDWHVDDVPVWERVRFDVHKRLLERLDVLDPPHGRDDERSRLDAVRSRLDRLGDLGYALTVRRPSRYGTADVLVFAHPRRKRLDGEWWNVRCDPVVDRLDDVLVLESPHGHGHRRPARTERLGYLDAIERRSELRRHLVGGRSIDAADEERIERLAAAIRGRFGVDVAVDGMVSYALETRRHRLPRYVDLLERVDPSVVVLTVSYGHGKSTQIEACKRLGVPVVELQHGVIDPYHMGYSYPGRKRTKRTFPDYLLVYGTFWRDAVAYPIDDDRVLPVGHPFMESRLSKHDVKAGRQKHDVKAGGSTHHDASESERLLFVSQGSIGGRLSRFAADVAADPRMDAEVVYKLHPAETARYPEAYPWLADADVRVADGSKSTLYELFASSTAQVGVYSTAVYEGLRFGLRTYVLDLPGAVKLRPLVEDGVATRVESVDELIDAELTAEGAVPFETNRFFEPNALEAVPAAIRYLRDEGTIATPTELDMDPTGTKR